MDFIYDLLLNYSDVNCVIDFFEWKKEDNFFNVKRIPIFRISRLQMNDILHNKVKISSDLLSKIDNKTFTDDGLVKYSFLITDLNKVLALNFDCNGIVFEISCLLLDEEDFVIEEASNLDETVIDFEVLDKYDCDYFLTRNERYVKRCLLNEIIQLYNEKNYDELNYLYSELYDDKKNIHKKYEFLVNDISNNFNSKYNRLYEVIKLIQGQKI